MNWTKYKHLYLMLFFTAFLSFSAVYFYTIDQPEKGPQEELPALPPLNQQVITPETSIYITEKYTLCEKYSFDCGTLNFMQGMNREELNGVSYGELVQRFPESADWRVEWEEKKITLVRLVEGLCPDHLKRWHLQDDDKGQYVYVYFGPREVGREGGLAKETEIKLTSLPVNLQEDIRKGALEFLEWDELIATLDSLDEYSE